MSVCTIQNWKRIQCERYQADLYILYTIWSKTEGHWPAICRLPTQIRLHHGNVCLLKRSPEQWLHKEPMRRGCQGMLQDSQHLAKHQWALWAVQCPSAAPRKQAFDMFWQWWLVLWQTACITWALTMYMGMQPRLDCKRGAGSFRHGNLFISSHIFKLSAWLRFLSGSMALQLACLPSISGRLLSLQHTYFMWTPAAVPVSRCEHLSEYSQSSQAKM